MKYPDYYCPVCNYQFSYNSTSFEYCKCDIKVKNLSNYSSYATYLLLIDNYNYYHYLDFRYNISTTYKDNLLLFKADYLITQDFINNFNNLANYL